MSDELRDERAKGWFHLDHALIDGYGATIGAIGIAVYAYLAHRADRKRVAWPSYRTIGAALGISRSTAMREVRRLEQHGLIRVRRLTPEGKRPRNVYTLMTIPAPPSDESPRPVSQRDRSTSDTNQLVSQRDRSTSDTRNGVTDTPEMVSQMGHNKNQLTRINKQEAADAAVRARAPTREDGGDGGGSVSVPSDLSPGDEERAQMEALGIPGDWYMAKWWSLVEHYENKPDDHRTVEKWRWTCRHLISEDWAKTLSLQKRKNP